MYTGGRMRLAEMSQKEMGESLDLNDAYILI
jgi:hypothetical protein